MTECQAADFARHECSANSQVGLITVYANYQGDPHYLLGTAPLYDLRPQEGETARFAFVVPVLKPRSRSPSRYAPAPTSACASRSRASPSPRRSRPPSSSSGGSRADSAHDEQRFPPGSPGHPAGCPELATANCLTGKVRSSLPPDPLTDNPTTCSGQPLVTQLEVQTYQDQGHRPKRPRAIRRSSNASARPSSRSWSRARPRTKPTPARVSTSNSRRSSLRDSRLRPRRSSPRSSLCRRASRSTPTPPTARPPVPTRWRTSAARAPTECPDSSKIGTFAIGSPTLNGPLTGSVYIGEPKPGDQYRLFLVASGFGMNVKLVGSIRPIR